MFNCTKELLFGVPFSIMKNLLLLPIFLLLLGCAAPNPQESLNRASAHLKKSVIKGEKFDILAVQSDLAQCRGERLFVYIEGDGMSWLDKNTPSTNPTPKNPLSLKLMQTANQKCSVYLARPCQYIAQKCDQKFWTSHRYGYEILKAYQEVLDDFKSAYQIQKFTLVGYSGGGVIATLLAAHRDDIASLITVAANVDIQKWTTHHHITPLYGSLNPADFSYRLEDVPQIHLIGEVDSIVPFEVFESYASKFKNRENVKYFIYPTNHFDGWEEIVERFISQ